MLRVLKLGGSLFEDPRLPGWLAALARAGGQVVLVPGGGPFADAVRTAQAGRAFPDATAHRMALLAMEQLGLALCGLQPGLRPAATRKDILDTLADGLTPVWMPTAMCLHAPDIANDWTVTSDSLAAWLAVKLEADALGLVKHAPPGLRAFDRRVDLCLVDDAFPRFAAAFAGRVSLLGHEDPGALRAWLASAGA